MPDKINIAKLRDNARTYSLYDPACSHDDLLLLIEAVEAAEELVYGPGGVPGLNNRKKLEVKLARFDFGEEQ